MRAAAPARLLAAASRQAAAGSLAHACAAGGALPAALAAARFATSGPPAAPAAPPLAVPPAAAPPAASSSPTSPGGVYGAPYTNSVTFRPRATRESFPPRADIFELTLSLPGQAPHTLELFLKDAAAGVLRDVRAAVGAGTAALVLNGRRLSEAELTGGAEAAGGGGGGGGSPPLSVAGLFGHAVELELDGVRWSVNEGRRLSALGSASKRALATGYAYVAVGGALTLVACVSFWRWLIPPEHQKEGFR
jgi:hypothetical protein